MSTAAWLIPLALAGVGAWAWRRRSSAIKVPPVRTGPLPTGHTWHSMAQELRSSQPQTFGSPLSPAQWQAWVEEVLSFPHQLSHDGARDLFEAACVRNAPVGLLAHWKAQGVSVAARAFALDRLLWENPQPSLEVVAFLLDNGASAQGNPVPGWAFFGPPNDPGDPVPYNLLPLARYLGHRQEVLALLEEKGATDGPLVIDSTIDPEITLWKWLLENEWDLSSVERLLDAGASPSKAMPFCIEMFSHLTLQVLLARGGDPFESVQEESALQAAVDWESEQAMRMLIEHLPPQWWEDALQEMASTEDASLDFLEQAQEWVKALQKGPAELAEQLWWLDATTTEGLGQLCSMASGEHALANADILLRSLADAPASKTQDVLSTSTLPWVPKAFKQAVAHRQAVQKPKAP